MEYKLCKREVVEEKQTHYIIYIPTSHPFARYDATSNRINSSLNKNNICDFLRHQIHPRVS